MISSADIALLVVVALILAVSRFLALRIVRRHKSKSLKYRLFKVRDDLIYAVASGRLNEDDEVFRYFYEVTNFYLGHTHRINLTIFVRAIEEARRRGIDLSERQRIDSLMRALEQRDATVQATAKEFFRAMNEILYENSFLLRILLRCSPLVRFLRMFKGWWDGPGHNPSDQVKAYRFHQDYDRASKGIASGLTLA